MAVSLIILAVFILAAVMPRTKDKLKWVSLVILGAALLHLIKKDL